MTNLLAPLFRVAMCDRRTVTDFDFRVLAFAAPMLDEHDARPLKLEAIAVPFAVDRSSVARALRRLVAAGFLIRVDREDHTGVWRYRLPRSPERSAGG